MVPALSREQALHWPQAASPWGAWHSSRAARRSARSRLADAARAMQRDRQGMLPPGRDPRPEVLLPGIDVSHQASTPGWRPGRSARSSSECSRAGGSTWSWCSAAIHRAASSSRGSGRSRQARQDRRASTVDSRALAGFSSGFSLPAAGRPVCDSCALVGGPASRYKSGWCQSNLENGNFNMDESAGGCIRTRQWGGRP